MRTFILFVCISYNVITFNAVAGILVLQSDFGTKDSAVAEMKGTALSVDEKLVIVDNTHQIDPFNVWEGAYRLFQSIKTFPKNSVFVSVIDPGVGTDRKSIVVKTKDNHYIVTPDNGTITFVDKEIGIIEAREIDETKYRIKGSEASYTFYGRDVYVYTGAKLASGKISFEEVGKKIELSKLKQLPYQKPEFKNGILCGNIPILDINYGNVWTNIDRKTAKNINLINGQKYDVLISNGKKKITIKNIVYGNTFDDVKIGEPILYFNSLDCLAIAVNSGNFAKQKGIGYGEKWKIEIKEST
ncbi:MAG: S-adenosyl-l-methionine hydroxide adenosyltransferase family protein [Elusimicrobia bacterium]|nr:S-adenosyl-l-methionine hydroxide adenosyltransferase family protein [Elusimicrobiota bacterium]